MNKIKRLFLFLVCTAACLHLVSFAGTPPDTTIAPMLQKILPAIVNIRAQIKVTDFHTLRELQKQRGNRPQEEEDDRIPATFTSVGSGVIVNAQQGYILTNSHVINDAQNITITLPDGRHFTAKTVGVDKPSDVGLLQIKAKNLTEIPFGDSTKLKVGDFVAAIGNPFGIGQTVTSGIISALGRTTLGIENYENFIQTDAPINPGNSGGALVSAQGQLIGINTAILAPSQGSVGIGFAIPITMVKSVMDQLVTYGDVKRGLLGIGAQSISPELANAFNLDTLGGAVVSQVLPNSPAEQAGLKIGDFILSVNGQPIKNANDVINTVAFLRVDSKTNIEIMRDKKKMILSPTLWDPKKRKQLIATSDPFLYGVGLKNISFLSPIYGNVKGTLVLAVEQGSNAWQSDLRPGDIITLVEQQPIHDIDQLRLAVSKINKSTLLLNIIRGPGAIFLVINKES